MFDAYAEAGRNVIDTANKHAEVEHSRLAARARKIQPTRDVQPFGRALVSTAP